MGSMYLPEAEPGKASYTLDLAETLMKGIFVCQQQQPS